MGFGRDQESESQERKKVFIEGKDRQMQRRPSKDESLFEGRPSDREGVESILQDKRVQHEKLVELDNNNNNNNEDTYKPF